MAQEIAWVAIGLELSEREAYLCQRAGGDAAILAEVRRRLELAGRIPDGFLDRPAMETLGEETTMALPEDGTAELTATTELRQLSFAEGRRYEIVEILGTGGMAVVFRAFDRRLERQVAIKHLRDALVTDPRALKRFELEARATARVNHPVIVQIFDVLHDRDDLWIVMELVSGEPLTSRLQQGPLELEVALSLAADIAGGLAAAHAQGIVHRDLKAANVMVTPAGIVKIVDFGLASSMPSADDSLRAGGGLYGTPSAMSPEQVSRSQVDYRSDLFSFGALLYQMVTGVPPFTGSSPLVTLNRVRWLQPPPASRRNPRVPDGLSSLIEALLEKDPGRRPQDTADVARALARLAESTTSTAETWTQRRGRVSGAANATAEDRQVTVLSCQLVAAGGSGRPLEAEEILAVEEPFRDLAVPILERCCAYLGECSDGGFMAYFGFPHAREDDPQRAVSAALELAAAVDRWGTGAGGPTGGVSLRAGINTGPIIVASGLAGRRQVTLGRTGCCAAEMSTPAESVGVLVSEATQRLVRGCFRFQSLGVCPLARCREPVEIHRVLAALPAGDEGDETETERPLRALGSSLDNYVAADPCKD